MPTGPDYRQVQAPEQVDTNVPDNGAALRAQELAGLFRQFEGVGAHVYNQAQAQAGAIAGAAAGATGHPEYKEGLTRFTAYSRAYNNAATGAYAVQAEAQADDAAARLRVQANNDPGTFRTTYSAVRDGVLKSAPAMAVPMLTELYNKRLAAGVAAISGDQAAEQQGLQRSTYDQGVARLTSRVAILQGSENPVDQAAAQDEHAKLSALIDGGVNAGLYSKAEGEAMQVNAMRAVTAEVFQTQVDRELARPDGDVVALLNNFRDAHIRNISDTSAPPVLSEPEFQKLMSDATTKIREYNLTVAMAKREGKTAEQMKFEAGDVQYTSSLLRGGLTERALDVAVRNGDLKPERATALRQLMNQGDQAKSDPRALYAAYNNPNKLDWKAEDVAGLPGVSWSDKLKLMEHIDKARNSWEGTQAVKDAKGAISAALKIPPGTQMAALSDEQKRALVDSTQEFIGLMNATDPAKRDTAASSIAQTIIQHAQQRQAQAEIQNLMNLRTSALKNHGPGSGDQWSKEKMDAYLKQKDAAIAAAGSQAKGQ